VTDSSSPSQTLSLNGSVGIIDDVPVATGEAVNLAEGSGATNVVFIIDTSGSVDGTSLAREKAAAISLLNAGINGGKVLVVDFNDTAHASGWLSVADAITHINQLEADGHTNYDVALNGVMNFVNNNATPAAAQTVAYFLSDGKPNEPSNSVGINGAEQATWDTFLATKNINLVYGVNVGSNSPDSDIAPIAYPSSADNIGIGSTERFARSLSCRTPSRAIYSPMTGSAPTVPSRVAASCRSRSATLPTRSMERISAMGKDTPPPAAFLPPRRRWVA
jgi:hypothetical protein